MEEYDKGDGRRLLVGYTGNRARKDSYNREKGVRRLEKAYRNGRLSKENINRRGYNKFLEMKDKVLRMAKTVTTIQVRLPLNGQLLSRTMVMKRHKPIEKLFDENFCVSQ